MSRIHRNLHAARAGAPQWVRTIVGRVDAYLARLILVNVTTRIRRGSAARCLESGVRAVVAFFDGKETDAEPEGEWQRVSFDPRRDTEFVAAGRQFNKADAARLEPCGAAFVLNPRWEQ